MTKPYKHKLKKEDLKHLKKFGMITFALIEKTVAVQKTHRAESEFEPCYDCKSIARKLGLPV